MLIQVPTCASPSASTVVLCGRHMSDEVKEHFHDQLLAKCVSYLLYKYKLESVTISMTQTVNFCNKLIFMLVQQEYY